MMPTICLFIPCNNAAVLNLYQWAGDILTKKLLLTENICFTFWTTCRNQSNWLRCKVMTGVCLKKSYIFWMLSAANQETQYDMNNRSLLQWIPKIDKENIKTHWLFSLQFFILKGCFIPAPTMTSLLQIWDVWASCTKEVYTYALQS